MDNVRRCDICGSIFTIHTQSYTLISLPRVDDSGFWDNAKKVRSSVNANQNDVCGTCLGEVRKNLMKLADKPIIGKIKASAK